MRIVVRWLERVSAATGEVMAFLAILLVLNVFLVVVLRYAFGFGAIWMQELYVWIHATIFLAGAGYTLRHDGHVRIDLVYASASGRYRALVNLLGSVFLGLPLVYLLGTRAWPTVSRSWATLEKSAEAGGLPGVYLFKSLILVFCACLGLQLIALTLRSLTALLAEGGIDHRTTGEGDAL